MPQKKAETNVLNRISAELPMIPPLVSVELLKTRKRLVTWICFGIVVAFLAFMFIAVRVLMKSTAGADSPEFMQMDAAMRFPTGFGFLQIMEAQSALYLVIVLVSLLVGSEYGWGTLRLALARGPSRTQFMLAKLIAAMLTIVIGTAAFLVVGAALMILGDLTIGAFDPVFPDRFWLDLFLDWLRTTAVLMIYVAIAFAAASLLRSGGAGIGVGLAFVVVEQIVMNLFIGFGGTLGKVAQYFPTRLTESVLYTSRLTVWIDVEGGQPPPGGTWLDPWPAAGLLTLYFVVLIGGAIWVFNKRDLTSGSGT